MSNRITIGLSDEQVHRLDELVKSGRYASRSAAVEDALAGLTTDAEREEIDRAIVDGYTRIPQTADELAWGD